MDSNIDTSTETGVGITIYDLETLPFDVMRVYMGIRGFDSLLEIDKTLFIIDFYKFLTKNFNFTIHYEYYQNQYKPSVYINGGFLSGLDWYDNKWKAMREVILAFLQCDSWRLDYAKHNDTLTSIEEL